MSGTAFPSKVTQVDLGTDASPARFPTGYEVMLPATKSGALSVANNSGGETWIYVYNDSGSEIAANMVVMRKAATSTYNVLLATASISPQRIVGISQHAIANGSYGFILKRGLGTVTADASVTADVGMIVDGSTAGNVTHAAAVTDVGIGCTLAGRSGSGTLTAFVDCSG